MGFKYFCKYCRVFGDGHSSVCKELYLFALQCELMKLKNKIKRVNQLIGCEASSLRTKGSIRHENIDLEELT